MKHCLIYNDNIKNCLKKLQHYASAMLNMGRISHDIARISILCRFYCCLYFTRKNLTLHYKNLFIYGSFNNFYNIDVNFDRLTLTWSLIERWQKSETKKESKSAEIEKWQVIRWFDLTCASARLRRARKGTNLRSSYATSSSLPLIIIITRVSVTPTFHSYEFSSFRPPFPLIYLFVFILII